MEPKTQVYTFKDESRPGYWEITQVLGRYAEGVLVVVQNRQTHDLVGTLMDNLKKVN